ncbi:hypothetical protein LINPERHAP1_LOCUS13386 [Linum perenne]
MGETFNEAAEAFVQGAAAEDNLQEGIVLEEEPAVQLTDDDLTEARERAELSLLARIFWEEPRELRVVENSFLLVWKCGRVRIFDVGSGLYQFVFPSVVKRNWVLDSQPWFFQRSIIHFTGDLTPSEELFHSLQYMPIWVKIIGVPFSSLTIAVGRKLLAKLGEVIKVGYFDAGTPEGTYVKGRVRMDLLGSFLGTTPVSRPNGTTFPAFFQYIGVPCICYLCGLLSHVMADCTRTDLVYDENVRAWWICGKVDPNEKEGQGPQIQPLIPALPPNSRARGGLPPSVAAGLSSNLNRQWTRDRHGGGPGDRGGPNVRGRRPFLALTGPPPARGTGPARQPGNLGQEGPRARLVQPLQILAPEGWNANREQRVGVSSHSGPVRPQAQPVSAGSAISGMVQPNRALTRAGRLDHSSANPSRPGLSLANQVQRAPAVAHLGPRPAASAPLLPSRPIGASLGLTSVPFIQAQSTPQSKLIIQPLMGRSSNSTSSGSAKRKLLSAFEAADEPPVVKAAGPTDPGIGPIDPAIGPWLQPAQPIASAPFCQAEDSARLGQLNAGTFSNNSDTNFDPDALFVSGSEEGEISLSGDAEEPLAVEVANPDRPPINQ